jgi:hypothetical protein
MKVLGWKNSEWLYWPVSEVHRNPFECRDYFSLLFLHRMRTRELKSHRERVRCESVGGKVWVESNKRG